MEKESLSLKGKERYANRTVRGREGEWCFAELKFHLFTLRQLQLDGEDCEWLWSHTIFTMDNSQKRRLRYHRQYANEMAVVEPDLVGIVATNSTAEHEISTTTFLSLQDTTTDPCPMKDEVLLRANGFRVFCPDETLEESEQETANLKLMPKIWGPE